MAGKGIINNHPRQLRDGEMFVDCAKARAIFAAQHGSISEDRAAEALSISRSVLRRILGKDDDNSFAIVNTANVNRFAERCGCQLSDVEWIASSFVSETDLELVNDAQHSECLSVVGAVSDEVIRPDMVGALGPQTDA